MKYKFLILVISILLINGSSVISVSAEAIEEVIITTHSTVLDECTGACKFFFEIPVALANDLKSPSEVEDYHEGTEGQNITTYNRFVVKKDFNDVVLKVVQHIGGGGDVDLAAFDIPANNVDHKIFYNDKVNVSVSVDVITPDSDKLVDGQEPYDPLYIILIFLIIGALFYIIKKVTENLINSNQSNRF